MNNIGEERESGNLKREPFFWFTNHLRDLFKFQKKYAVKAVAKDMGTIEDSLYRYIREEREFPLRLFIPYLKATVKLDPEKIGDIACLKFIANELGYSIVPKLEDREELLINGIAQAVRNLKA